MADSDTNSPHPAGRDFIRQIIDRDLDEGKYEEVVTRFPPEPNGFLHIGHAKSILLNFGIAQEYGGRCHLRFDDTNPVNEEPEYARAIREDVRWLGFDWGEHLYHAADYFDRMYAHAETLIEKGKAYVDSQSEEEIREGRGSVTEPGTPSPYRDRSPGENLDLFRRMRAGEFPDGSHVLRARIDMGSPNMLMRDPILYRIRHASHYRSGDEWCVYPLYDYAHCLEDAIEGVTHSLCTLEFANNRDLYDWILDELGMEEPRPHQYEFARGELDYTITSKRKLLRLVREGRVDGWDDPRVPTIAGLRRRGIPPEALLSFWNMVGVARSDSRVDIGKLEYAIRDDLNQKAPRVLAVLRPLRIRLIDWDGDRVEEIDAPYFPRDVPREGSRTLFFSGELYIDREDFSEDPPRGFRRLVPGGEVRLRYGCVIRCEEVVKDESGEVVELRCSHDPETWGGEVPDGRKVKGTIQWLSAAHAVPCEVRLYDRLFTVPDPSAAAAARGEDSDYRDFLNPESLKIEAEALVEPSVLDDPSTTRYQFERLGYFWRDPAVQPEDRLVFNRIVTLRDTWSRVATKLVGSEPDSGDDPEVGAKDAEPGEPGKPPPVPPEVRRRAERLEREFGLGKVDAEIVARDPGLVDFFERAVAARPGGSKIDDHAVAVANWLINDLPPVQGNRSIDQLPFGPAELSRLVILVLEGVVSSRGGGEVLEVLADEGGDPDAIVDRLDLVQVSDESKLAAVVDGVLADHPEKVEAYRSGKQGLLGFFMGRVMAQTGGRADPELAKELLRKGLD